MKRFASPGQAQRFLLAFSHIRQHFRPRRYLISAPQWRTEMTNRFAVWDEITVATAARRDLPVVIKGPTGCGKTRFIEAMAYESVAA
jgi:DNA-binding NtrC family response regulator